MKFWVTNYYVGSKVVRKVYGSMIIGLENIKFISLLI